MKNNMVAWFEIPVTDMDRAKVFYESVFKTEINLQDIEGVMMGFFPANPEAPGAMGSLMKYESYIPSHEGTLIYFSSEDVQRELNRIRSAGGNILMDKTQISPDIGYMGMFQDTEGNRIALYSQK